MTMRPAEAASALARTISAYAAVARPIIRRDHLANSCIASTRITIDVFQQLGYHAEPLEVVVSVGDKAYVRHWRKHGPPRSREDYDHMVRTTGAVVIGIGQDRSGDGIGGHVVAVVEDTWLVDASLDQVSRMTRARIPPVFTCPILPEHRVYRVIREVSDYLFVEYVPHPTARDYRTSPDWTGTREIRAAVAEITKLIRPSGP